MLASGLNFEQCLEVLEVVRTYVDESSYTQYVRELFELYSLHDIIQSDALESYAVFLRNN